MSQELEAIPAIRKIAIILASIDREDAVRIMRMMVPKTVQQVTAEIRALGEITPAMQQHAFDEMHSMIAAGINPVGGDDLARSLLEEVVGDEQEADKLLEKASEDRSHAFSAITRVNGKDLANVLSKEQPSTAAIILAFMPVKKAAEVMSYFDEDFREEIITRLAQRRNADPAIVSRIEQIFVDKVISLLHTMKDAEQEFLGGPNFVADMFQYMDREIQDNLLDSIQNMSKDVAEEVRDLMFTFEDIASLQNSDIQKLLREVPMDKLQIALRGTSEEIFDKITNNLSKRARENLIEEMDLSGKIKKKDVELEQRNIVAAIRALEAAGEIQLSSGGEDDAYV